MKISSFPIILTATLVALIALPAWGQNLPHPYDKPAINFQGRIEEGDIGYSGDSTFKFWIGDEAMTNVYWGPENAETTCVEGIYNVILGRDTADLPSSIFTGQDSYYLQVAFSTDGTYFETLAPVQEILTVPFAVNADLLDGLESPESAFVGVTDVQIITNKTLTDPTLTRPVIDSSYFRVTPGTLPDAPDAGYFAYDNSDNKFKYWDGSQWVALEDSSATSPWTRVGTTIIPQNEGDFVQLTGASRLLFSRSVYGSAGSPLISFNPEDGGTGIFKAGPDQIDFSTQSSRRFTVRSTGAIRFIPIPQPASGMDGDFYYDTDQESLMYFKGATWHPVASGTGSIMDPLGADSTLRGSDGTTWVATTGFLISADGTATVQKDIRIRQKMFFYGDTNTYIQGPDQDTLEFYTGGAQTMTLSPDHRLRMTFGGTKEVPAISFSDQSHLGIYANSTYNHISFAGSQTDMFSIRGQGHVRFRPLGTAPTVGVSRTGDLHYNNTENTFMYFKGSTWHPIASGTGSIMNPIGADCTLRGSDGTTWVATTGFLISADGTATVQKDIRIRQKMFFYGDTNTYIQGPDQDTLEFYTGGAQMMTLTPDRRLRIAAQGTRSVPAVSFGNQSHLGVYADSTYNHISFAGSQTDMFSIRGQGHIRFRPLGTAPSSGVSRSGDLYFNAQTGTFMYYHNGWKPIASGEGSIPKPDQANDTLYASDGSTWSPNRELRVYPGTKVATWNDLQVGSGGGQKLYWGTAASTYITSPAAGTINFYTGNTERMRIIDTSSSAATPLITFQGDNDTGIWKPAADNIAISTGGTEAFRINANQLMGINTLGAPAARLEVKETATRPALRVEQSAADQYAVNIEQGGERSAIRINQTASTGDSSPGSAAGAGGALHIYAGTGAFGSAITAFSNQSAAAPLVWFRGGSSFNRQPILRLQANSGTAAPLHLVPMANEPAPGGTWNTYTGAFYVNIDGTLYYNNGTEWQALPGEGGSGDGTVVGTGSSPQVAYWTESSQISGQAGFEYDDTNNRLTAVNATFTGLSAATAHLASGATINEFSIDGTLAGNSDAAVPTEQAVKTYVDGLPIGAGLNGAGTANTMAYWTNESTLDDLAAMTDGQLIIGSTGAAPAIAAVGTSNGITSTVGAGTLTVSGISATETDIGVIEIATNAEAVTGTATDKAIVPSNLAGVFAAPPPIGVTTAAAGAFTNLTASTAYLGAGATITEFSTDTTLAGGNVKIPTEQAVREYVDDAVAGVDGVAGSDTEIQFNDGGNFGGDSAFTWNTANDKLTVASGATTTTAVEITADSLTSGRALEVTSNSAGATGDAMVYIERGATGRALQVRSNNPTGSGVWVESTSITSGQTMMIKANSPGLTAGGSALTIEQDHSSGLGKALFVQQDGAGEAARFTLAAGATGKSAIWVQANRSTEAALSSQTGGGAIHIQNSGNTGPALTAYSTQTAPQSALAWLKVMAPFSGQPVLRLEGRTTGANPLHLVPQAAPAGTSLAGEFYVKTDGSLHYYNGTDWIALTGDSDSGGSGDGTVVGTGSSPQVAYWTQDSQISGQAGFEYDAATKLLTADNATFTGLTAGIVALNSSGSAGSPIITWATDPGTGMYRPIANTIGFTTAGNLRFSIRANGQTRFQPLDAEPGSAAKGGLYFNNQSDTFMYHDGSSWKPIASGEGSIPEPDQANDTLYASDGSTWSPNRELRVYPGTKVATWNDLQVGSGGGQKLYWGTAASTYITSPAAGTINFYTGNTERMRIIDTSSSAATPLITFQGDNDTGIWKPAADNIAISTGGTEAFRINANQLMGINTLGAPAARLEVKETATRPALRVEQSAADQYAVNIEQGGERSAIRINQTASTGDSSPGSAAGAGGALHIYAGTGAFGSAITAFSNQSAAAPLVWFRGGSSFNRQPILRLQANSGTAAPLHLVPMANEPAPGGTWNTYTGAFYVNIDGTLYYNNGTEWQALPGEGGSGDGTVVGTGSSPQVAYWTESSQISGQAGFEYDDTNNRLTAVNATFTGLSAATAHLASGATINEFSIDGTLAGNSDAAVPTEQAVKTYVDGLPIGAGLNGAGTANTMAYWTNESTLDDLAAMTDGQLIIGSTGAAPAIAAVGTSNGITSTVGAGTLTVSGISATETDIGVIEIATNAEAVTGTATDKAIVPSNLAGVFAAPPPIGVTTAAAGAFTNLTAGTVATGLTPGHLVWTGADGLLSEEAALAYNAASDKVTLASTATDGEALQIVANNLTTGTALDVSSTAANTKYDLVTFTANTGRALVISHSGGSGGENNEAVLIERTSPGRALGVHASNTGGDGVYIRSSTAVQGNVVNITASSDALTTGAALQVYQSRPSAGGNALYVRQAGTGKAAQFTNATGKPAIMITQSGNSDSGITQAEGGALHILNTGNNFGGLTVYSNNTVSQANPLVTFRVGNTTFPQPVLHIDPPATGDAAHLYLTPIAGATFNPAATSAGMLYASSTTKSLMYYNGTDWIALTGSAGGAGDFALRDLSNITGIAAGLIPDADNTRDLGSSGARWKDLYVAGTGTIATADINGGNIDGTLIGATVPSSAEFTNITADIVALDTDGSAAAPALTWDGDNDTGFYRSGNNAIGVTTSGNLRATFDATGHFILNGNGSNTNPIISLGGESNTGIYQASNGNIDFTLLGKRFFSMRDTGVFLLVGTGADPAVGTAGGLFFNTADKSLKYSDGARWITLTGTGLFGSGATGQATFWSSATSLGGDDNFFWDSTNKRLGIGTQVPDLRLDVRGTNPKSTTASEDVFRVASTGVSPLQLRLGLGTHATAASRYAYLDVDDDGTARNLILQKDGGYLGIGTSLPRNYLDLSAANTVPLNLESPTTTEGDVTGLNFRIHSAGNLNRKGAVIFERTASYGRGSIHLATENSAGSTNVSKTDARLTVTNDGKVGIGTTAPAEVLSVAGRTWLEQTSAPATTTDRLYNVAGDLHWAGEQLTRWAYRDFTRTSDATFTVTNDAANQAAFKVGTPIRYADSPGTWSYGMVTAYSAGTVTLAGAPMTASYDAYLQTGSPEMLRQVNFYQQGDIAAGDNFMGLATWQMAEGYVVRATGQLETAANGTDALLAIGIGGASDDLIAGAGQLNLGQTGNQAATTTNIAPAKYKIGFGQRIYVNIDQIGSTTPGAGLLVTLQVITP